MDVDRAYVKQTQQQYHKNSLLMEPTRIKEKRQAQEDMEKSSGAGDDEAHHIASGTIKTTACDGGNSVACAPLHEQQRHKSSQQEVK